MLLADFDKDVLTSNLGVRSIHAKAIMREITKLKEKARSLTELENKMDNTEITNAQNSVNWTKDEVVKWLGKNGNGEIQQIFCPTGI